jgi:hypothetical protein
MTLLTLFLLLLLFFAVFYGVIRPWLRRRDEARMRQKSALEALTAAPAARRPSIPPPLAAPGRSISQRVDLAGAIAAPPGAVRRQARWPVGNLLDARRGIVLATLLGPCRALDRSDRFS